MAVPSPSHGEAALAGLVEDGACAPAPGSTSSASGTTSSARTTLGHSQRLVLAGHLDTVPPVGNEAPTPRGRHRVGGGRVRHEGRPGRHARPGHDRARAGSGRHVVLLRPGGGRPRRQRPARAVAGAAGPAGGRRRRARGADQRAGGGGLPGDDAGAHHAARRAGPYGPSLHRAQRHPSSGPAAPDGWPTGPAARSCSTAARTPSSSRWWPSTGEWRPTSSPTRPGSP